jgi:hypothetical protein
MWGFGCNVHFCKGFRMIFKGQTRSKVLCWRIWSSSLSIWDVEDERIYAKTLKIDTTWFWGFESELVRPTVLWKAYLFRSMHPRKSVSEAVAHCCRVLIRLKSFSRYTIQARRVKELNVRIFNWDVLRRRFQIGFTRDAGSEASDESGVALRRAPLLTRSLFGFY